MKKLSKIALGSGLALLTILPAMANNTTIGFSATVDSVISLQLERTSDNVIVSGDDVDPGSFTGSNDVISFGTVTPLGIGTTTSYSSSRAGLGTPTSTIQPFVIDTTRKLYAPSSNVTPTATTGLPKGNNDGAIYVITGALQLRALRNTNGVPVGAGTSDIDVDNSASSTIPVIVAPAAQAFTAGTTLPASTLLLAPSATFTPLTTALPHDTAYPITIGIKVPFTLVPGAKTATLTFRAT